LRQARVIVAHILHCELLLSLSLSLLHLQRMRCVTCPHTMFQTHTLTPMFQTHTLTPTNTHTNTQNHTNRHRNVDTQTSTDKDRSRGRGRERGSVCPPSELRPLGPILVSAGVRPIPVSIWGGGKIEKDWCAFNMQHATCDMQMQHSCATCPVLYNYDVRCCIFVVSQSMHTHAVNMHLLDKRAMSVC